MDLRKTVTSLLLASAFVCKLVCYLLILTGENKYFVHSKRLDFINFLKCEFPSDEAFLSSESIFPYSSLLVSISFATFSKEELPNSQSFVTNT